MSGGKYCLVKFVEDGILYVVSTRSTTLIEGNLLWAPYKSMGFYEAHPIKYNNSRALLETLKNSLIQSEMESAVQVPIYHGNKEIEFNNNISIEYESCRQSDVEDKEQDTNLVPLNEIPKYVCVSGSEMSHEKYCLVKFVEDDILYVVKTSSTKSIGKNLLRAPFKKMGIYDAYPIKYDNSRASLEILKKSLIQSEIEYTEDISTKDVNEATKLNNITFDLELCDHSDVDNEEEDPYFIPTKDSEDDSNTEKVSTRDVSEATKQNNTKFDSEPCDHSDVDNEEEDPNFIPSKDSGDDSDDISIENVIIKPNKFKYNAISERNYSDLDALCQNYVRNKSNKTLENVNNIHDTSSEEPLQNFEIFSQEKTTEKSNSQREVLENLEMADYKQKSVAPSKTHKKHFCYFCKKLISKFARHLLTVHKTHEEVEKIMHLPKKNPERMNMIAVIRHKGDFLYNVNESTTSDNLIVVRRRSKAVSASHYKPCGKCWGMYCSSSLATHYRKTCKPKKVPGTKESSSSSRSLLLKVNSSANYIMKNKILPRFSNDEITRKLCSDPLIILYGNRLTQRYRSPHNYKMIRAKLRCVGTCFHLLNEKYGIIKFEEVFHPSYYDKLINTINMMAGLSESEYKYRSPGTAKAIAAHVKKISYYLISECIKRNDKEKREEVRDFLQLIEEGLPTDVYKTVDETVLERKRLKHEVLPTSEDIEKLSAYLSKQRRLYFKKLLPTFNFRSWKELASIVLISLQIFNRRRSGESELLKVEDFLRYERIQEDDESLADVAPEEKLKAKRYIRFLIRGKLSRGVPVMMNQEIFECVKLLLKYRKDAGVPKNNPYLFGLPGVDDFCHLSANILIRKYSKLCDAVKPNTLRGTLLRKHIATKYGGTDIDDPKIKALANYLGHHENIHRDHYRLQNASRDIVRMSGLLEKECPLDITEHGNTDISNTVDVDSTNISTHKRLSWSDEEKSFVEKEMSHHLNNFDLPSLYECKTIIDRSPILNRRSATQLKAFVANFLNRKKRDLRGGKENSNNLKDVKRPWSTPEKHAALRLFDSYVKDGTLPSLKVCKEAVEKNNIFKGRTPQMLKAFLHYKIKKRKLP